ncbi:Ldh family oxidoreductase [Nakamurella endophytica]|uniref:Malate/lactate/ureidoglycolate dehydrogenase n=1 Tax=Nakamurella endophytica TaxID=1748367 RepID=A0A917SUN3_9ACTN|nr:Ldh family oxidoreductase [Nakamurella endophytica]GGL99506.1 malate/lactate/ureidoglycolate dehydrogenase [Nakamurella endophytica]
MTDRMLTAAQGEEIGTRLLEGMGTPRASAEVVARSLVSANLCGHDSHGLLRLPWYAEFLTDGRADAAAEPVVERTSGASAVVDGRHGWGQLAGRLAVRTAAELARQHGVSVVTAHSCNHIGRLGEYAEDLAAQGLVSILWCNADPSVAPFGGRQRLLGTDPFAAGIPSGERPPLIVDFATAAVAEGKLRIERAAGRQVAPGLIQDADGRPSTDPEDFYSGGSLLPFGGHKGFGLAVLVELLGGALSGNHVGFLPQYRWGNGLVLLALAPGRLIDPDSFAAEITEASDVLRGSPPAEGVERVLLPGDVERATRERRLRDGFPMLDTLWDRLVELGDRLGVRLPA